MRACEIKALRWIDVDLFARSLTIPKSKTVAGERTIPLTDGAYKTLLEIRKRAEIFGSVELSHYIFPALKSVMTFNGKEIIETKFIASIRCARLEAGARRGAI